MDPAGPVDDAKNASPTGPWTAHRARRPQAPQALLPRSRFTEKTVTPELLSKWRDEGTQSYFLKWLDRNRATGKAGGWGGFRPPRLGLGFRGDSGFSSCSHMRVRY